MDLRIIFFIVLICTSCASVKELRVSYLEEIDYLLNTPTAIAQYNVEYRNYGNRAKFEWDTLVVNVEEYNYPKLDSLFLELTLNPDSWKVSELLKVYETFEGRFFDRYNSFIEIKKWTLGANVDHSHILDDAIGLIRNMDYLIYAKNRYGRKGFNKSYDIFKRECALREEFRKREKYEDWREATRDMDEVDYFTSKKYRYHVIQGNIWP